ncbi:MAG: hypothetical protein IPI29_08550 [Ignavibacteria bacterium]|nr:hypothetical protein [Ignavibacteria bacterium]
MVSIALSSGGFQAIIAVGAVVAVVAAVKALTDAWHTTAEEKLAGAKADGEMIASAQKAVNAQITLIGVNNEAINQYAELGAKANRTAEEQDAFEKATMSVARSFPHAWQATATFAENVDALKKKSAEAGGQLDNLMKKSEQLAAKAAENDKYQISSVSMLPRRTSRMRLPMLVRFLLQGCGLAVRYVHVASDRRRVHRSVQQGYLPSQVSARSGAGNSIVPRGSREATCRRWRSLE